MGAEEMSCTGHVPCGMFQVSGALALLPASVPNPLSGASRPHHVERVSPHRPIARRSPTRCTSSCATSWRR